MSKYGNKIDVLAKIKPEMTAVLKKQDELVENAFSTDVSYQEMRENYIKERKFWNEGGPSAFETLDLNVDGPHGEIPIRFYYPNDKASNPAILYIHGGGFVVGNIDTHDRIMRIIMEETQAVVIGIDYSLSPEVKFPVAIEECAAVTNWVRENAAKYRINPDDISFAGDSGGANLSLGTTIYLRDHSENIEYLRSLLLFYGAYGLKDSMSRRLLGGDWDGLKREDLEAYWSLYIENENDYDSPYYDCLNADFDGYMPACYIAYAEFDPLRDDSIALYSMLMNQGQRAKLEEFKGVIHAFLHHSRLLPDAYVAMKNGAEYFKKVKK